MAFFHRCSRRKCSSYNHFMGEISFNIVGKPVEDKKRSQTLTTNNSLVRYPNPCLIILLAPRMNETSDRFPPPSTMALLCRRLLFPVTLLLLCVAQAHAGLVLHYAFDETSGTTAADSSGSGNTGTLNGMTGAEWTTGRIGGALSFDGTNDYVEAIGYKGITGTGARTVALWFKTSNSGVQMPLVDYGGFWLAVTALNDAGIAGGGAGSLEGAT